MITTTAQKKGFQAGMPPRSDWFFVYRPGTQFPRIAYWDFEKFCWTVAYEHRGTTATPDIESMKRSGWVAWNTPDVSYFWKEIK